MGVYSLSTLLCTLGNGRSKNINPTTLQLAQSSVVATSKCLEKSKTWECVYTNTLPSSDNFQQGDFLLWSFYTIIYFHPLQSASLISSQNQYKLLLYIVSSFAKEFSTCIVHCMDIAEPVCPACRTSYLFFGGPGFLYWK